jgi:hypothetical protein
MGLELVIPAPGSPAGPRTRQIASAQRIRDRSRSSISLVSLVVRLTIAIATKQFEALIREWILEAAVRALLRQLYRKPMQALRLEAPRTLLVAAAE